MHSKNITLIKKIPTLYIKMTKNHNFLFKKKNLLILMKKPIKSPRKVKIISEKNKMIIFGNI
jgi:hypothetical protein